MLMMYTVFCRKEEKVEKPNILKASKNKLVRHFNSRYDKNHVDITAWEWKDEQLGLVIIYFDGGETETDADNWTRKRCTDINKDDHFRVFSELKELVGYL
jgi:hypothetical protein